MRRDSIPRRSRAQSCLVSGTVNNPTPANKSSASFPRPSADDGIDERLDHEAIDLKKGKMADAVLRAAHHIR